MSSITADGHTATADDQVDDVGPLEQKHLQYANYRAVAGSIELTKTHWHIATANALGWGFDGMDGVIFALISPMVIKEFAADPAGISLRHADRAVRRHRRPLFLAVACRPLSAAARCSPSTSHCSRC